MSKLEELIEKLCPNGIEYKALIELGDFYGGLTGKSKDDFKDGNANFISYMNVYKNPALDLSSTEKVKIAPDEKQRKLEYCDVIFTGSSETPEECAISSVVTKEPQEDYYLNSFCFIWRMKDNSMFNPDFLKHLFRSETLRKKLSKTASGVTRFNVSKKLMESVDIPIPPLEIQNEIVKVLDKFIDLKTELTEKLTAELTARKQQYEYYRDKLLTFSNDNNKVEFLPLRDVIISLNTGLNPRQFFQLNTPDANNYYVTIREMRNGTIVFTDSTDRINDEALKLCNKRSNLEVGDVLFSGTGTIGETVVIENEPTNWNIKEGVYTIKPNKEKLLSKFLHFILHNSLIRNDYMKKAAGGTVKSVKMEDMKNLVIPVPSLEVQEKIVNVLDNFDAICSDLKIGLPAEIEARQKQYEYYRDKLLNFDKFGGGGYDLSDTNLIKLLQYVYGFINIRLGDIGKISMCKRIMKSETNTIEGVPFYKIGTFGAKPDAYISWDTYELYKKQYSYPKKGDILISAAGTIGRTVVFDGEPAYFQDSNIVWIDNNEEIILNRYLYYCYQLQPWQIATGGTIARLYNDNLASTVISVPAIKEQERIVSILDKFDTLVNDLTNGIPAEIEARQKQYEYYRDKLLTFKEKI